MTEPKPIDDGGPAVDMSVRAVIATKIAAAMRGNQEDMLDSYATCGDDTLHHVARQAVKQADILIAALKE